MRNHSLLGPLVILATVAAASCASLVACSGGGGGGGADGGDTDGGVTAEGGPSGSDGGVAGDGSLADGGPTGPVVAQIILDQAVEDDGMGNAQPYAFPLVTFTRPGTITPSTCNVTTVGVCKVVTCTLSTSSQPSAYGGAVTISTPMIATTPMTADLGDGGLYTLGMPFMRTVFMAGDPVSFHTSGAPPFPPMNATVIAPSKVGLTTPVVPVSGIIPVMRNQDLHLEWDVSDSPALGQVTVTLSAPFTAGDTTGTSAVCYFKVPDGMGKIPAAAMMTFNMGQGRLVYNSFKETAVPVEGLGQAIFGVNEVGESAKVDFQ